MGAINRSRVTRSFFTSLDALRQAPLVKEKERSSRKDRSWLQGLHRHGTQVPAGTNMKTYAKAVIALSIFGAANALYLTVVFAQNTWGEAAKSFCDFNSEASCTDVITNRYSQFLGVPVCTIALLVYPILAGLG
jgi:hypothetical protein